MQNKESVLENETFTILGDFHMQADHLISAIWPELVQISQKKKKKKKKEYPPKWKSKKTQRETSTWTMPEN